MIGRLARISLAALALPTAALAADMGELRVTPPHRAHAVQREQAGTYPLSRRAAKIRRADRCWRGCLAEAGRGFQGCLRVLPPNDCVARNDAADRYCLHVCRLGGGPWVRVPE